MRIRTLGYPNNGESVMISLMNGEEDVYNVFIDNYEDNGYQYWLTNLPQETRINVFIWTHPDEDHSLGVDKLLAAFDPKREARIFMPSSLTERLLIDNNKNASLPCYRYMKTNYNKGRMYQWNEVSLFDEEPVRYCCKKNIINRKTGDSVTFRIGFMLPKGSMVNRRTDISKMNSGEMNHLSLFLIVELNKARYIFAGDLAAINIQFLEDDYLSNCRFIKIPHHGSKDPIKLIDKIQPLPSQKPHSVTTIYSSTHPYSEVLDRYAQKCEGVYSTGRGKNRHGLVEIDYHVRCLDKYDIKLEGNAHLYGEERQ